jgi:microcompartment protein CcmL/EutN
LREAVGLLEIAGWSPAMVVLDAMEKAAWVRVIQVELNDRPGVIVKVEGSVADVQAAIEQARTLAQGMEVEFVADVINAPHDASTPALEPPLDFNPLIEQPTVVMPAAEKKGKREKAVADSSSFAVGLIETQGFTAVFEAIDTAVKTAAVEVLAREKLGGGYITVVIKGDVAAVRAAIDAGKARVDGLGRLIAAHVIPNPSPGVLSLLPKL